MNKRLITVLGFALIISAVASLVVYRLISARLVANAQPAMAKIVVASHDLEIGTLIKDTDLAYVDWTGNPPKGALAKAEEVVGRGVISTIYAGEPVLETRIAAKGAGAGLAATIPKGMRAVALPVNEVVGLAGFVTPGMRVDILIAGTPPNSKGVLGTQTKTLLQNIEVLSAGQHIQKDAEGKPIPVQVVNLLVTPEQAEILSLAHAETRIQLVLRNPIDTEEAKTNGTAVANLFSGLRTPLPKTDEPPAPRKVKAAAPKPVEPAAVVAPTVQPQRITIPITVEVIHGINRTKTDFKQEEQTQDAGGNR
jgi:pilus assembly protein CpaB